MCSFDFFFVKNIFSCVCYCKFLTKFSMRECTGRFNNFNAFYILHPDLYGKIMYLQGIRKDRSSPLLNDFGGEMTFFMWDENEPIADLSRVYLRTSNLNPTSMKVTRGQMARHFLCFIM